MSGRILAVTDFSIGYGGPQVVALVRSLRTHFALESAHVIEPDQSERPPRHTAFGDVSVYRVGTTLMPAVAAGLIEFNLKAAKLANQVAPDVVVVTSPLLLSVLRKLRRRPKLTIYYMLESFSYFDDMGSRFWSFAPGMVTDCAPLIDVVVCPDENRAALDLDRGGLKGKPLAVLLNAVNEVSSRKEVAASGERRRRVLYSGTIQKGLTYAEYFINEGTREYPIDLYGLIEGADKAVTERQLLSVVGKLRYCGYTDAATLGSIRRSYAYAISMWNPSNPHQLYAAPNKFYEAIADGVPPITAPHPQCKAIVERYGCGIVLRDWSYRAFINGLDRAMSIFGTSRYADMVEGCRTAVAKEVNWPHQFEKLKVHLPEELS